MKKTSGWIVRQGILIVLTEVADPALEAARMPTGHEAYSAGLTGHSRGVEPGEPRTTLGEAVDIRRLRIGVTVATEIAVAQVVGENENDVWLVCRLCQDTTGAKYNANREHESVHGRILYS